MKKIYSFLFAILIAGFALAQNNVTIQVDMTGQTVASAGVHVAGSFQGWDSAATALTQVGTTDIYEATVNMADGKIEYKFLNGDAWGTDESVPALSGIDPVAGNGNRWSFISGDTTLPAIMFGMDAPMSKSAMRLAVDMQKTGADSTGVFASGSFQAAAGFASDWTQGITELWNTKDSVYERIFYVAADTFEYKFNNGSGWETIPGGCEVNGNRQVDAMMDVAQLNCYASCGPCPTAAIPTYNVTVRVDMNGAICSFDVDSDYVDIAGPFNGWGGGDTLLDPDGDGIYEVIVVIDSGEFRHEARSLIGGNTNWEGGNTVVQLTSHSTLDLRCFGSPDVFGACSPLQPKADVTFRVDMTSETLNAGGVFVMGNFTNPAWQGGAMALTASATNPAIFELEVADWCPNGAFFKYINGDPNGGGTFDEETYDFHLDSCGVTNGTFSDNRVFERVDDIPVELNFVFNTCNSFSVGVNEVAIGSAFSIYPNPTNSEAVIALNYNLNSNYSIEVMDITGKIILSAMNYKLSHFTIDGDVLNSGLYLVKVTGNNTTARIEKLIVK